MELRDLIATIWKHKLPALSVLVATVVLSTALAFARPPRYEATASLALLPETADQQILLAPENLATLLGTYAAAAEESVNVDRAEALLGRSLPGEVEASTEAGSGVLRIRGIASDPEAAAVTARAAAEAFQRSIAADDFLRSTLISPPVPPETAMQPRPPLIIAVGALLGLGGGILATLALEYFRRRVETAGDVAEITSLPLLARLPRKRGALGPGEDLVWGREGTEDLQEALRGLRTNLEFLIERRDVAMQITSPGSNQGKSTITANLGVALARIGIRTVIVDGDLRRPRQHHIFGLTNYAGLSNVLRDGSSAILPQASSEPGLSVLTSGPVPADPTEILHLRLGPTIAALRRSGAFVLVDSPPLLAVTDAQLIAEHVDEVLLVVAAGVERPAAVREALRRLELVSAHVVGVALNLTGGRAGGYYRYPAVDGGQGHAAL